MHRPFSARGALCAACILFVLTAARAAVAAPPSPSPSPSQTAPNPSQTAPNPAPSEIGRVVTSDRRLEPVERTSRPTFVVDRTDFEARGARTVSDAIASVPGVDIHPYGGFGATTDYGIRGATSAQTLVLLNGIPIAPVSSGIVDLGTMPLAGVQRIEIVESGASTLYGTSATGGVINIITGPEHGADVAVSAGSYGDRDARVALGDGHLGFSYERHVADNDYDYPAFDYGAVTFPAGVRYNAWAELTDARLTFDQNVGSAFALNATLDAGGVRTGVPGPLDFLSSNAVQATSRMDGSIDLTRTGAHTTFSLTASASRQALGYADPAYGGETDTYDARSQVSLKDVFTSQNSTLVAGIDLARETSASSLGPFGPPPSFSGSESQVAAYLQDQLTVAKPVQVTLGLRGENDAPHGTVLAPAFGALFNFGDVRLAGNVGESFRVPSLIDLYYPGDSNPNLVPEKARNEDVTLSFPKVAGGVSLGWFGRDGTNFIVLDQNYVPQNAQKATIAGIMVTAATPPMHGLVADVSLTNLYKALDIATGARLPRDPNVQATLGLTHPFGAGGVSYGVRARIVGSDGDSTFGPSPDVYDAYTSIDAYLRFRLQREAILTFRAGNLGDARFAPVAGYPAPGRTFGVELSTR
jgi:vitamin B12 transporter